MPEIVKVLDGAAYTVASISRQKRSSLRPCFINTSTMQQEASRRLGFTATAHHARGPDAAMRARDTVGRAPWARSPTCVA